MKHQNQHKLGKLQLIPTPNGPWQWIQSDFMGELLKSDGFNAIYVVSDQLMKMAHFIPAKTDISTPDLMKLHICHIGNCMEFHSYMVLTADPLSLQTS